MHQSIGCLCFCGMSQWIGCLPCPFCPPYWGYLENAVEMCFIKLRLGCCLSIAATLYCYYHLVAANVTVHSWVCNNSLWCFGALYRVTWQHYCMAYVNKQCSKWLHICLVTWRVPLTLGPQAHQGRAAALQGRGWDAEGSSAPQHRPLLWFLGVCAPWQEMHRTGYWTHDIRNTQNVSTTSSYLFDIKFSTPNMPFCISWPCHVTHMWQLCTANCT